MGIKIGIIGAGSMVDYHIKGFLKAGAEIKAIADVNLDAAREVVTEKNIENVYNDPGKMLPECKDMDAVSIITPNRYHKSLAIQSLKAGKHVFCEKPPALNAAEVVEMKKTAEKAGKTLMFNFNNRARSESQAMMTYIKDDVVGQINSAQALWIRRTGIPGFGGWFSNKELSGGGPVIDLLHMMDLALYFMNYPEPQYVLAQTFDDFINDKNFKGPWGIPDVEGGTMDVESACHGLIRFKTGQVLFIRNSWAEMNKREEVSVTFQGEKAGGMIRRLFDVDGLDETSTDEAELYVQENGKSVNQVIDFKEDETMGRVDSAANFIMALEGKKQPLNTIDQAVKLMKIVDAVYESAVSGKPVEIK